MADSLSLDRQVLNKKIEWVLKKEGCLRDNLPHLKKNQKKKKWRAFEKFIEKWPIFWPVFFINKQHRARFFKIGSVVPEIICRPFEKKNISRKTRLQFWLVLRTAGKAHALSRISWCYSSIFF